MIYDPESNILSWEVGKGKISHVREFGNFIIHLSTASKPILIEMLDASNFIGKFSKVENIKNLENIITTS